MSAPGSGRLERGGVEGGWTYEETFIETSWKVPFLLFGKVLFSYPCSSLTKSSENLHPGSTRFWKDPVKSWEKTSERRLYLSLCAICI